MTDPSATLTDFATLAFVIAHGADADMDAREMDVLAKRVETLAEEVMSVPLSGSDLSGILQQATDSYSALAVTDTNELLDRLGRSLQPEQRAEVYAAFVEIAAADGTMHTMEQTLLRHIAVAWHLG